MTFNTNPVALSNFVIAMSVKIYIKKYYHDYLTCLYKIYGRTRASVVRQNTIQNGDEIFILIAKLILHECQIMHSGVHCRYTTHVEEMKGVERNLHCRQRNILNSLPYSYSFLTYLYSCFLFHIIWVSIPAVIEMWYVPFSWISYDIDVRILSKIEGNKE